MKKLVALFIVTLFLCLAWSIRTEKQLYKYHATQDYTIQVGDTLTSIAYKGIDNRYNVRKAISDIKSLNSCTSFIRAGDRLLIPLYDAMQ